MKACDLFPANDFRPISEDGPVNVIDIFTICKEMMLCGDPDMIELTVDMLDEIIDGHEANTVELVF